jgi:hypothetical protein
MQTAQIDSSFECVRAPLEQTFSSVWGNEMQREDFLRLAKGMRHYNASLSEAGYMDGESISSPVRLAQSE